MSIQSPLHRLHHLPQIPPWVPGITWHGDRRPRVQTSPTGYIHEVGGNPRNLPGTAQGMLFLGQVQVSVHLGGVWSGSQGPLPPPQVLREASDGGAGGRVICRTLKRWDSHDTGVTTVTHQLECGGGHSGPPLGVLGRVTSAGGGQYKWRQWCGAAGRKDDPGKRRQLMEGRGEACADEGEGGFFYKYVGMVDSTDPGWIQTELDTLTGVFDQVGLQENVQKTVGMVYKPCREVRVRSDKAYTRRITGEGRSYKNRQQ